MFYDAADLLQSTDGEILIRFYVLWYLRLRVDDYHGVKSQYMSCMNRLKNAAFMPQLVTKVV